MERGKAEPAIGPMEALGKALDQLYTEKDIVLWLESPQPMFNNRSALEMIRAGETDRLTSALNALLEGAYI